MSMVRSELWLWLSCMAHTVVEDAPDARLIMCFPIRRSGGWVEGRLSRRSWSWQVHGCELYKTFLSYHLEASRRCILLSVPMTTASAP